MRPRRLRRLIPPALLAAASLLGTLAWPRLPLRPDDPAWEVALEAARLVLGTVCWLSFAWLATRIVTLALDQAAARRGSRPPRLLGDLVGIVLFIAAVMAAMAYVFKQPVTGLVATSGVIVAIVGFALRNIIGDFFSGIALNVETPYHIGDWLQTEDGTVGRVVEINWRATRMVTRDSISVIVPNGRIAGSRFLNYSTPERYYRAIIPVTLDFDVPVERARRVLVAAACAAPAILRDPAPDVRIEGFTERGVRYLVRYWVPDGKLEMDCRDAVAASIHHHLRLAGIPLPHGRQDITLTRLRTAEAEPALDRVAVLRHVALFKPLGDADIARLAESLNELHLPAGSPAVCEGEAGASLFVVVEGLMRVTQGPHGTVLATLQPGAVFGEMSLLTGEPRSATVTAETDATLFEVTREHLRPILTRAPELAAGLSAILAERQEANALRRRHAVTAPPPAQPAPEAPSLLGRIRGFFGLG